MAWHTRGTSSTTGFSSWGPTDPVQASDLDAPGLDVRTWGANVDASGFSLLNCAGIGGPTGANPLTFTTNGAERARIDSSGRLGVGTATPVQVIHTKVASGDSIWRADTASQAAGVLKLENATGDLVLQSAFTANLLRLTANGHVQVALPTFASDAAAGSGGLTATTLWKDSSGNVHIKL